MDPTTDSEEGSHWDSTDDEPEAESSGVPPTTTTTSPSNASREAGSEAGPSRPPLVSHFMDMGFEEEMIIKAIGANGGEDMEAILETLLTYRAVEKASPQREESHDDCFLKSDSDELDDDKDDDSLGNWSDFVDEEFKEDLSAEDKKLLILVEMGFSTNEASAAINRCGSSATVLELADSIHAAQVAEEYGGSFSWSANLERYADGSSKGRKRKNIDDSRIRRNHIPIVDERSMMRLPKPMVGFGLPFEKSRIVERKLPESAIGPPFFYYENVALTPKGVWETISRFLYDIEPEFVDSKYFCAAARKRGYIHNFPIRNRFPLVPIPPKTIQEALPATKRWWPSWDTRKQLNCIQTSIASGRTIDRIRQELSMYTGAPPLRIQQDVINECKKGNLVWVGTNKVAQLEPDELEMLLGFPKDHTRGGGISRTKRYKSLGNSFHVDTVGYHLSVLKDMFPNGMNVLSLFSGIGGGEVALHRLGIHLKAVVSVEILEENRNILRSWWDQTNQSGVLIDLVDVTKLDFDKLSELIGTLGGFDLVIGGSPCNNFAGSNRYHRDGLEGEQSSLVYDYFRILELVKGIMGKR